MADYEIVPEDWGRALAVVAHPDDLEYGASGAVARWTAQGKWVGYVMASRGEAGIAGLPPAECAPLRTTEQVASARLVGVDTVEFLDHPDGVIEYGVPLRRDITAAIRRHRPDVLITLNHRTTWPFGNRNTPDHRNVGEAVLDAVGDAGNEWIFPEAGPAWGGVRMVLVSGSPEAGHAVDIGATLDVSVASLRAHDAYLRGLGDSPLGDADGFLRGMAARTAERFGGVPACPFELIAF
ncbi:GlcNAc-PI de-N-acetylase [Longispora fulva]|uniref:LmbE family N-acetylglucosaminyl deacetylase n=1 Tax=Longispora fulva TaxID=619741 RepID=A0A8J7GR75_9ACTN|nr:PIG-L deacetylase family protein [Longispora fulva]MBG6137294.1 LmbE family N-acetylglucosaminyl deacetylase [Longispora fulva]GIG61352.1 GlcNAc-PI de-N-acetylase [Longispora fulva]